MRCVFTCTHAHVWMQQSIQLFANTSISSRWHCYSESHLQSHLSSHNQLCTRTRKQKLITSLMSSLPPILLTLKHAYIQANIHTLHELVQPCAEEQVLKAALVHVKAAVSVLQSMGKFPYSTLQAKHLYPSNMNCEKQHKFLSTKKKRESSATTMRKPSLDDIKRCKNTLQKYEPRCCGVCLQEEDKATTKVVEWTQCASCGLWLHTTCSNSSVTEDDFICHLCL